MHELPAVLSLLDTVQREARQNQFKRVSDIYCTIGELSGYVEECIGMYFESASAGTAAEGAKLHFRRDPAMLECTGCGYRFPHQKGFDCPQCGAPARLIRGTGTGFTIERIVGEGRAESERTDPASAGKAQSTGGQVS